MKVLVVGAGMYVTGRGTNGIGTVLPALCQASRELALESVLVVAQRPENATAVADAARRANAALGTDLAITYRPLAGSFAHTLGTSGVDAAIVCVPDDVHFAVTSELMELGIHCLVVKPLVPTCAEARQLIRLQHDQGLYCAVELHKRFDPQNLLVRQALRDGRIGRPVYMMVGYSQRIDIPLEIFRAWASRTNIFQYLGVHYADLIYFLTGYRPIRLSAIGTRGVLVEQGLDTWDSIHATIVWRSPSGEHELTSQLGIGWIDPRATSALSDQRFFLVGSHGRVDLDQKDRGVSLVTPERGIEALNPHFSMILENADGQPRFQGYGYDSLERFLLDVADVRSGRIVPRDLDSRRPTFVQALVSTAIVEAATRSVRRQGEWENVDASP